jgi:catechol 2,3-dioxygenase-like lactoylglutathione lyase family enzyme
VTSRGLAEIVLVVENVAVSARFYEEVVGLTPRSRTGDEWAWFWAAEEGEPQSLAVHRGTLLFEEHSPYPEGERFGRIHFALNVARDDLEDAAERVRAHGVEVYGPEDFEWMQARSYYFYDPDGNLVELWSPDVE